MNEANPAQLVPYITWGAFVLAFVYASKQVRSTLDYTLGGVTALGCTIGQAVTGISTLALGSILTFAAIVAGSALTMKFQYWRMMRAE